MLREDQVHDLVQRVLQRIIETAGEPGRNGPVIAVFSGATVGLETALQQVVKLLVHGFQLNIVCSEAGRILYGGALNQWLEGLPGWGIIEPGRWFAELSRARAVIAPMLSVNTLSKLAGLLADDVPSNLLLHGLFLGKPVVLCVNGVDPEGKGRMKLGFDQGNAALTAALKERISRAVEFGCVMTDVGALGRSVLEVLSPESSPVRTGLEPRPERPVPGAPGGSEIVHFKAPVLTAADIRQAGFQGASMTVSQATIITPLAREMAQGLGVSIRRVR